MNSNLDNRLDENTIRYCLYPHNLSSSDRKEIKDQYQDYVNDSLAKLTNYLADYYWYYTPFNLNYIEKNSSHSKVTHIEGCTNFDENIQDEWFIVFLLFELSKEDDELVIQVEDSDGYFLLIEVADYLPKWLNPKTSANRCFIYRGELHLITIEHQSSMKRNEAHIKQSTNIQSRHQSVKHDLPTKPRSPTIEQALSLIRDRKVRTKCSSEIQDQIKRKITAYPTQIQSSMHRCRAILPISVAFLLDKEPTLICHAVRAFYNRDDLDLAACRLMKNFQPKQLVNRTVKMSRFNYAQLLGQNYKPDLKLNWYSSSNTPADCSPVNKQYDLGFKISCGFEILVSNFKKQSTESSENSRQTTRSWRTFVNNLKRRNYFHNLIEQSNEYNERLAKARSYFENSFIATVTSDSALIEDNLIGRRICDLLDEKFNETTVYEQFKELELENEDSDAWLSEVPECLLNSEQAANSFDDIPGEITNCLQEFIKADSDYKGVESENPKKRKSDLKERAFKMMSDNLRSIITMKVSDSESEHSETDLSDYNYTSASSDEEMNELKYMKQSVNKSKKFKECLNERKKRTKFESSTDKEMKQLMNEMDKELSTTSIGQTFDKLSIEPKNVPMANCAEFDDYSDDENAQLNDVEVEYNTVKNLLGSFKEQNGLGGPASTILNQLGVRLPNDID